MGEREVPEETVAAVLALLLADAAKMMRAGPTTGRYLQLSTS
jgi:hypothetical protein